MVSSNNNDTAITADAGLTFESFRNEVLADYKMACISRAISLLGRKEVLTGKAKFGIFGDGKEVAQIAMAKFFRDGDFRSGYYRDQTIMLSLGLTDPEQYFAQLYADTDPQNEPFSRGRQMNAHYTSANFDEKGDIMAIAHQKNTATDLSPTAGQMPRSVGLALASKLFRQNNDLRKFTHLSNNGNEVCFCTIGDAATSEGHFWEAVNAAGVLQIPLALFIWDDGYGISVPVEYQTIKGSISEALSGFEKQGESNGMYIYQVKGWDYAGMCQSFEEGIKIARTRHIPVIFHVNELTQPQGHSTSGSHERYKSRERLKWEKDWDCNLKMREWMLENELATSQELDSVEQEAKVFVLTSRNNAWKKYITPIINEASQVIQLIDREAGGQQTETSEKKITALRNNPEPLRKDILKTLHVVIRDLKRQAVETKALQQLYNQMVTENLERYTSFMFSATKPATGVTPVDAVYAENPQNLKGFEVINRYFDQLFENNPLVVAFGEDVGDIGDVNQGFSGLQKKHGTSRIFDTGIRELTVMGKGIGLALRGLRPIAEIQYLDYLLYGLQPLSDDVATLHYRTGGLQSCPIIVRTRGHRLEGIWHTGSPLGMMVNSLRGMHICVPRNMTQAAGMYNTLLQGNDPAIVVESLNGYRLPEQLIQNLDTYAVPLGIPEIMYEGTDITIVSYGSVIRIIEEVVQLLAAEGISCELIDVRTLLPFDTNKLILESLKKTSRILFIDEDVPGGATAFMFNEVIEKQGGYKYLDAAPRTLTAVENRTAFGTDGDYFCKPNAEQIELVIRELLAE